MFRNRELASVGIETLALVFDVDIRELEREVSLPKDESQAIVMCWGKYIWYGFDFRQNPSQRDPVIGVIADPPSYNELHKESPILKRGIYFAKDSTKIDIGWYITSRSD